MPPSIAHVRNAGQRQGAQDFIRAMEQALVPLTRTGGRIQGPPGPVARTRRTQVLGYAGGPFHKPTRARPTPPRMASEGYRHQVGEFRLSGTFDRIYAEIDATFEESILSVFEEANAFMRDISPVETGEYARHVMVEIIASYEGQSPRVPRKNRFLRIVCRMMTEKESAYNPDRDPREYAIFVEYGGDRTPPYFVFRRTMDFALRLALERFQKATSGRAFRGLTPGGV